MKKNSTIPRSIFCIFLLFIATAIISSCSSSTSQPESKGNAQPEKKSQSTASPSTAKLKVKGFYLGMSVEEAIQRCNEYFPNATRAVLKADGVISSGDFCSYDHPKSNQYGGVGDVRQGLSIFFSQEKKAIMIMMDGDKMLDAASMQGSEFAKKFMDAYGIPELKPSDDKKYWQYVSRSGERVRLWPDKGFVIDMVPKGSFN